MTQPAFNVRLAQAETEAPADPPTEDVPADLQLLAGGDLSLEELAGLAPASNLTVNLPPAGAVLNRHELMVWGTTEPGNEVVIAGQPVPVDSAGRFRHLVELPSGSSTLVIETIDPMGNRGRLEWPVEVANVRYFLMALGDGAVGTRGAHLDGLNDDNHITTDSSVASLLYGQARVYFKGWVSGQEILSGAFDEWTITAYADTGRQAEYQALIDEAIEPERYYPVYGDSSEQVNDVDARGKVYVLVTADESRALWGSYQTDVEGVQLLQYHRTLYGGQLVINETFAEDYATELRVHAADDENGSRQAFDYLRGTGGSYYYLRHDELIEGSERVALVVRDRTSGIELHRRTLSRNDDYTIRYAEGRLRALSPIPSVADANFMTTTTTTTRDPLIGHHVFLEVSYEFEGDDDFGETSFGAHARETYNEWLTVGGGYIREGRGGSSDGAYQLWGVEVGLQHSSSTRIDVEYVESENRDTVSMLSDDGGLTYDNFNLREGQGDEGSGVHVAGGVQLADLLPRREQPLLYLGGYYEDIESGFYSSGSIMDQGQQRFGAEAVYDVAERHEIQVQHDGVRTTFDNLATDDPTDSRQTDRQVSIGQYTWRGESARVTVEYGHTESDDSVTRERYRTDLVAVGTAFDAGDDWTFGIDQEVIARSDDPSVLRRDQADDEVDVGDRFTTGVSAGYRLLDNLELRASERVRYSGETATQVGFRTAFSDEIDLYLQERFETYRDRNGTTNSIVIGGENRWGPGDNGRSWAEYQIQDGVRGDTNRVLMGLGQRIEVLDGLRLDLLYERSQTDDPRLGGDSSRDAGSVGVEYLGFERLTLSTQFEFRLDNGNEQSPRQQPCLGDGTIDNPSRCRDQLPQGTDRFQWSTFTGITVVPVPDLTLFSRFLYSETEDLTLDQIVALDAELTFGTALRPVDFNWINALLKYTYLVDQRPFELGLEQSEREASHVFSVMPIINFDRWGFQLVEKVAYRHSELRVGGLPSVSNDIFLWINRVNYHLTSTIDAGVEYRLLTQTLANDRRHGVLLEANYILQDYVRLGLGYNFTSFTDDELGDFSRDESGVFFRVTGQY